MNAFKLLNWRMWQLVVERFKFCLPSLRFGGGVNALLITNSNPISKSQIFPFYFYSGELRKMFGFVFREINIDQYAALHEVVPKNLKFIGFQPWMDIGEERMLHILGLIRQRNPNAKVVFLDSFAPLDLRWANAVSPYVDLYVKKHVFAERMNYYASMFGDTNLMDYYGRKYTFNYSLKNNDIPAEFLSKILVGASFVTSPHIFQHFLAKPTLIDCPKTIDLHARISYKGTDWYEAMRTEAIRAVDALKNVKTTDTGFIKKKNFLKELSSSRMCLSPFGYGEVSWRDYEAVMCGSVLIKPSMDHVETYPDIFVPYKTYIPIKWDLSDLSEKVAYYLSKPDELNKIKNDAYMVLSDYVNNKEFLCQMKRMFL